MINGLHHVTAVTSKAQENLDFYTGVLGMRLVKRTVNQDDVSAYHLFYGDKVGNAGTELTFFDWPAGANRNGAGSIARTDLRVPSRAALGWWAERLSNNGIDHSGIVEFHGHELILFADPEGQALALVNDEGAPGGEPWEKSPVPAEYAIRGLYANLLIVRDLGPMADIMTQLLGYSKAADYATEKGTVTVFTINGGGAGNEIYIEEQPTAMNGFLGHGGVHHIAFRVADGDEQEAVMTSSGHPFIQLIPHFPRADERFRFDAERISDAVDVVEVGNHLGGVVDGAVIKAVAAQFVKIGGGHLGRIRRDFDGKGAERVVDRRQIGLPPIGGNLVGEAVGFCFIGNTKVGDLGTEVVGVGPSSIEAVVVRRDNGRQHLPLPAAQR